MDAFEEGIRRLQGDLDDLRQLIPRNGDGEVSPLVPPAGYNPNLGVFTIAENTQGIQSFFQGSSGGFTNGVPLVEGKTTVLRVYPDVVNRSANFPLPTNVTAEIRGIPGVNLGDPESRPINGPIAAKSFAATNRGNANDTLNFRLMGWRCTRSFVPYVRLFDADNPGSGPQDRDDPNSHRRFTGLWRQLSVSFPRLQAFPPFGPEITDYRLRLVCVRIIYTGPDANNRPTRVGPLSEDEVIDALSDSFLTRTYPISGINYIDFPVAEFNGDLRVGSTAWDAILTMLRNMRSAAGSTDVYLGLLPTGIPSPSAPGIIGRAGYDGVATTFSSRPSTLAHEIGHAFGRRHSTGGAPVGLDPTYPTCGSLPAGSICEFGFGTKFSTVLPPETMDFMHADLQPSEWISPYTFIGLRNAIYTRDWVRHPTAASPVAPQEAAVEPKYLHLNFRMYRDGSVDLLPSFHLSRPVPEAEGGPRAPVAFELRDADGQVIGFYPCHLTDPDVERQGPYRDFHKVVPWNGETRSIAFFRDGEGVAEVEVEQHAPEIRVTAFDADRNRMRLEWEGQHETKSITYLVRYSNDGGENWLGLAAGLTEPKFVVDDLDALPGGDSCVFQIVASSTIRTTVAETEPVSVPVKPRRPYIVSPGPDSAFLQGGSVTLAGLGYSPDFETAPLDEVVWTSNVAGFLGYGYEVITNTLAPGLHKITLSVPDGLGGEASADVRIRINPAEDTISREEE